MIPTMGKAKYTEKICPNATLSNHRLEKCILEEQEVSFLIYIYTHTHTHTHTQ